MIRAFWHFLWPADVLLCILWIALFGDFGKKYIGTDAQNVGHGDGPGIVRMKIAVWVDLTCAFLWLVTSAFGWWGFLAGRRMRRRSLFTGRAVN